MRGRNRFYIPLYRRVDRHHGQVGVGDLVGLAAAAPGQRPSPANLFAPYPVLNALETSRATYKIGNSATALGVILVVFVRHLGELADEWCDSATGDPLRIGVAPSETVFGVREIPVVALSASPDTSCRSRATVPGVGGE